MNNMMNQMLQNLVNQNPQAYQRAQQMCAGKSPEEMKQLVLNLAQSQGRNINDVRQMFAMFGINF